MIRRMSEIKNRRRNQNAGRLRGRCDGGVELIAVKGSDFLPTPPAPVSGWVPYVSRVSTSCFLVFPFDVGGSTYSSSSCGKSESVKASSMSSALEDNQRYSAALYELASVSDTQTVPDKFSTSDSHALHNGRATLCP